MKNQKKISIITPVFNGKNYIKDIIRQVENQSGPWESEILFVNDNPCESIDPAEYGSESIDVRIFNTDINRGIHGARVWGLSNASGEYVLFLDQDDRIFPDYMQSQMEAAGNADAVVCRCIHEGKQLYNEDLKFEDVVTREHILTKGCPIISPGQVMIKRSSIPAVWKENIMQTNCSDDYLLWLCMAAENREFALNQSVVYEHVVDGNNVSSDYNNMIASEEEMYGILAREKVFSEGDLRKISGMLRKLPRQRMALLMKFRKMFMTLNRMLEYRESGCPVGKYLKAQGINKVAIYGNGYVGKRLAGELSEHGVETACFIDRNADYLEDVVPVYKPEYAMGPVDMIIISVMQEDRLLKASLTEKQGCRVKTISEILEDMAVEAG